jgi:hypothetical protein
MPDLVRGTEAMIEALLGGGEGTQPDTGGRQLQRESEAI